MNDKLVVACSETQVVCTPCSKLLFTQTEKYDMLMWNLRSVCEIS